MDVIWRRFELIDKAKEGELIKLLNRKNLSQKDLILIFQTLRANESYFKSLAEKEIKKV